MIKLGSRYFTVVPEEADGNCQFRALSRHVYKTPLHHFKLRGLVCDHLRDNKDNFSGFVTQNFLDYLRSMRALGTYGDHVTLQAFANMFNVNVVVVGESDACLTIQGAKTKTDDDNCIFIRYVGGIHYDSLREVFHHKDCVVIDVVAASISAFLIAMVLLHL